MSIKKPIKTKYKTTHTKTVKAHVAGSRFVAPSGDQVVKVRGIHENPTVHMPPSSDQSVTTFNRFVASSGDQLVIKFVEHM